MSRELHADITRNWRESRRESQYITICLGMPRSGTTLLMRLMNVACMTNVMGDRPSEFFEGWINIFNSSRRERQHGHLVMMEDQRIFADEYSGYATQEIAQNMTDYYLRHLLVGGSSGFMKSAILGFNNELVEPFLEAARQVCESEGRYLKVVFLIRDIKDCTESLYSKWIKENIVPKGVTRSDVGEMIQNQLQQFRSCFQLGDLFLKYEDLVSNPMEILTKLNPKEYPHYEIVPQVMSRVIR